MDRNFDTITFTLKYLYFRKSRVSSIAGIIKIATIVIKTTSKDSEIVKRIRNYVLKWNLYLHFLIKQKLLISGAKMLMPAEIKVCITWFIYFWYLLSMSYNCAKFHHCRICVTNFREEGPFLPPSMSSSEKTHPE